MRPPGPEGRRPAGKRFVLRLGGIGLAAALLAGAASGPAPQPQPEPDRDDHQRPRFGPCEDEALVEAGARCATVRVPLDYGDPGGRTVSVAISRIAAGDPATRRGILLFNPGGPGGPGLDFPAELRSTLGDVADRYDLVGFDPRFVGRSSPISCGPTRLTGLFRSPGVDRAGFEESVRQSADFAERCHERHADLLPHAGTRNVARDMDVIRAALGERRLSYYGVSYGTDVGAAYAQLFPRRVDRMVLDSASGGDVPEYEVARGRAGPAEAAFDEWAAWAAQRDGEHHLGRTAAEVRATVTRLVEDAARRPIDVDGHAIDDNMLPVLLEGWLNDSGNDPCWPGSCATWPTPPRDDRRPHRPS